MSKYDPLWKWISENEDKDFVISYSKIEDILGFSIDHSFLTYKKELLEYGFEIGKISMKNKTIEIHKK